MYILFLYTYSKLTNKVSTRSFLGLSLSNGALSVITHCLLRERKLQTPAQL